MNAKTRNLLIVDDDEDDFFLARDLLNEIPGGDYNLDWASSYEEGMARLRENRHHLCLMDYRLGSRDGIELLREAQALGFNGPVILLTGMQQGGVDLQALEAGAVDYLVKDGLTAEQLARAIRYALVRREAELERVERLRAEADNRAKSEFLAHLSHELRTPMSAILGFTELLLNTARDEESRGYLQVVRRNGKHLLGLLNDILDLSKIEAGKLELETQSVEFLPFVTDVYFLMQGAAADKNIDLRVEAPESLPERIHTDPTRLRQVLLNLLGNAIKFTETGEVVLHVSPVQEGDRTLIGFRIRDTGVGIRPEALEQIFLPFVQSGKSMAESHTGTGLGLTISRQLVQRLGGDIEVSSQPGRGSEFSFTVDPGDLDGVPYLPFELSLAATADTPNRTPRLRGRVLVVDDLRDIRALVGHFVAATGAEVRYASHGEEALRLIARANGNVEPEFDLVLMDIHMPVLGGLEAARALRADGFIRPLVALTAANMKGDRDACLAAGFTTYLSKPVDQHRLHTCLARYLAPAGSDAILLVEDDADAGTAMTKLLELLGHSVTWVKTGEQALNVAAGSPPALILLDLHLPDMDGYRLAEQLTVRAPGSRKVLISGAEPDPERARAAGIDQSLLKPVGLDALQQIICKNSSALL